MEMRKLMAFGQSSYIVSVPKGWVKKNKLKKGDILVIEERLNELAISAHEAGKKSAPKEISIQSNGKSEVQLRTEINSAYINNYDIITVMGEGRQLKTVKSIIHSLAGMEVLEETSTKIVAKEMLDVKEVSLQNIVRRMDLIIRSMLNDLLVIKEDLSGSLYERDAEVNRLKMLAFRTTRAAIENPSLLKLFEITYWNATMTKDVTARLERLADQVKRMAKLIENGALKDKEKMRDFKKIYLAVVKWYAEVIGIYYAKNKAAAYTNEGEAKNLLRECDDYIEKYKTVPCVKLMQNIKYIIVSLKGILRDAMEAE
ncbi:phosphate uptake regulator PhoU [Candidatus Woesearchaeota archaeon]|nr:phosphate uptake regulator PhoU [Candidatus Woesearchaeota archaeon]